jgi:hypothetical protein
MREVFQSLISIAARIAKGLKRSSHVANNDWLDRTEPFSRVFGLDRGSAIDRRFMDDFIQNNAKHLQGSVLEVGDDQYTYKYGSKIIKSAILAGNTHSCRSRCYPSADLTKHESLAEVGIYDCVIATNVLNFIYDIDSAVKGLAKLVKPGSGVVLVTVAGIVSVSRYDYERWGDYWRFNDMSVRYLFERHFRQVEVSVYGNAPLAAAFIMGLSQEEVPNKLFEHHDRDYQILIAVKARALY